LRFDEPVEAWSVEGGDVRVATACGEYRARRMIIAAGAWVRDLSPGLDLPLQIERQVLHWFEPAGNAESFRADRCPVHLWQFDGRRFFYGFPDLGRGVKAAFHHDGAVTTIDDVRRAVDPEDVEALRAVLRRFAPGADGPLRASVVCVYTNTPDEHFWIDRHPQRDQVIIASACSGHGFKFAPAIGEILADMAQDRPSRFDLRLFRGR
jgi:sarcosine oxidase